MAERCGRYEKYWIVWQTSVQWNVQAVVETGSPFDDEHFASGNYYNSESEAQQELDRMRAAQRAALLLRQQMLREKYQTEPEVKSKGKSKEKSKGKGQKKRSAG